MLTKRHLYRIEDLDNHQDQQNLIKQIHDELPYVAGKNIAEQEPRCGTEKYQSAGGE
jgi:hypothetical protein